MTDKETKDYLDKLDKLEMSNSETYDKEILMIGRSFLFLCVVLISNMITFSTKEYFWLLNIAMFGFMLTIISVIISIMISQSTIKSCRKAVKEDCEKARKHCIRKLNLIDPINMVNGLVLIFSVSCVGAFLTLSW